MFSASIIFISQLIHLKIVRNLIEKKKGEEVKEGIEDGWMEKAGENKETGGTCEWSKEWCRIWLKYNLILLSLQA